MGPDNRPTKAYFTYDPPWVGKNAGLNVLFDMGITLGEFIIANCPKLHWDPDPISVILPRTARRFQETPGLGFQWPILTGFEDPVSLKTPLHIVYGFACQMAWATTTLVGIYAHHWGPPTIWHGMRDKLLNVFEAALQEYPAGDPFKLREQVAPEDYLDLIDRDDGEDDKEEIIYGRSLFS